MQSDWFLPVLISSHDIDTARGSLGMCLPRTHLAGLIHYNAGIYFQVESNGSVIIRNFGQILNLKKKLLKNENKGIGL